MTDRVEEDKIGVIQRRSDEILFELSPRWVRVSFGGEFVADSKRTHLLMEPKRLPIYYFPIDDVRSDLLEVFGGIEDTPRGKRRWFDVVAGGRRAEGSAWTFESPAEEHGFLEGFVAFHWDAMDAWFEEDDEVFVHARDPYHRVDVLQSSRHVRVEIDGVTVAYTRRPRLLFETGLPTRYYVPKLDVRMDLLRPSDTATSCPYKGTAVYWSAQIDGNTHEDIVWAYPTPIPECPKIENHLSFFNEHVTIYVDGEEQPVPITPWSKR